jgi:hypothetical protein
MERGPRETKERGNGYGLLVPSELDRRGSHREFQRTSARRATHRELSTRGAGFGATCRAPHTAFSALARDAAGSAERGASATSFTKRAAATIGRADLDTVSGRRAKRRSPTFAGNAE